MFQEEDLVLIEAGNQLNRGKLDPIYEGPFSIKKKVTSTMYEVQLGNKTDMIHISQMKHFLKEKVKLSTSYASMAKRNLVTLFAIIIFAMIQQTLALLDHNYPIIWRKTENAIIRGFENHTFILKLEDPCQLGSERNATHEVKINELQKDGTDKYYCGSAYA